MQLWTCLCKFSCKSFNAAVNMFVQGFLRVFNNMPDICLDVPNAYQLLETFATMCHKEGFLSEALMRDMPQKWVLTISVWVVSLIWLEWSQPVCGMAKNWWMCRWQHCLSAIMNLMLLIRRFVCTSYCTIFDERYRSMQGFELTEC